MRGKMKTRTCSLVVAVLAMGGVVSVGCAGDPPALCDNNACGSDDAGVGDGHADGTSDATSDVQPGEGGMLEGGNDAAPDAPGDGGCTATSITCNGQCVDPAQPAHCGSCTNVCTAPTHGQATCTAPSTCGFTCDATYHACNGACLSDANEPSTDACVVSDTFGVFVAPNGSDSAACTKAAPCQTIAHGMTVAKAANKRTYVCEGTYAEQLVVNSGLDGTKVFGGFACGTWAYDASKKPRVAPAGVGYALVVDTASAQFTDVAFEAIAAQSAGESSVTIFAKNATSVVLRRSTVTAGNGQAGTNAGAGSNYSGGTAQDGSAPNGAQGGPGGVAACTNGDSSFGGNGGNGVSGAGSTGGTGGWSPVGTGADGAGGTGGVAFCSTNAHPGSNGAGGTSGLAPASSGVLDATGWHSSGGGAGSAGKPAQGGGGGGGTTTPATGGSGGGAGGCGGGSGAGGLGGGASIGVLSFRSAVTLDTCVVTLGNAGKGGDGGTGQTGQGGGARGNVACSGGYGGNGGGGGGGAGGAGGISVGVLYTMTAPTVTSSTITPGSAGAGGAAGGGGTGGSNGLGTGTSGAPGAPGPTGTAAQTLASP